MVLVYTNLAFCSNFEGYTNLLLIPSPQYATLHVITAISLG